MPAQGKTLLQVDNLVKHFPISNNALFRRSSEVVHAVDGVSFDIQRGETLGLVGESGCGKSTTGRTILQLYKPTSGSVIFEGVDLVKLNEQDLRMTRRRMQMIFQDPYASLNPRMTIGEIVGEPLLIHGTKTADERRTRVRDLLDIVGLNPEHGNRYPHEFSGGQRQRIGIARALALNPKLIVCDEPVSALDLTTQARVLDLFKEIQERTGVAYLFVSHDLAVVRHLSHRVAVMLHGEIVEWGDGDQVTARPQHPYTQRLFLAAPVPDPDQQEARRDARRLLIEAQRADQNQTADAA